MALLQQAKNRIVARGAGIVCMVASNDNTKMFIVDEEDFDRIKDHTWCVDDMGYVRSSINYQTVKLHRFVKNALEGVIIDHKNGNKLDNRKDNLRECNGAQNNHNRGKTKNNTSGFKGVCFSNQRQKWLTQISFTVNGVKNKRGKLFDTAIEAARQYNEWAREFHGEFARLNDI